jgi:integrase
MAAHSAAMNSEPLPTGLIGASKTKPGTIGALVAAYLESDFKNFAAGTRTTYRGIIERFRNDNGHRMVATLTPERIRFMLANRAAKPSAAMNWLKVVRALMRFAIDRGFRDDDPTDGVRSPKIRSTGYATWSQDRVQAYRDHHALGTRARLALELLICTGQRRSDVVRMGRQHVHGEVLSIRQQKTGVLVEIPVLPDLRAAIDAMPAGEHLTFLVTQFGAAFTAQGFGNWFRERCNEAGVLKGFSAHGCRKYAATYHADHGATAHELMAWFGWTTLKEAERYTRAADRKRLARGMAAKLETGTGLANSPERFANARKNP